MKLPHNKEKFYPEWKSQTVLRSLRVSCKRALTKTLVMEVKLMADRYKQNTHIKSKGQCKDK